MSLENHLPRSPLQLSSLRWAKPASALLVAISVSLPNPAKGQVSLPIKWARTQVFDPQCAALSNDNKWAAVGGMGGAILYNRTTGVAKNLEPLAAIVNNVSFSPDCRTLAITAENGSDVCVTELWDVATVELKATIPYPSTPDGVIAFAPTGSTLAIAGLNLAGTNCIQLWNTTTLKPIQTFSLDSRPVSASFSRDGRFIACAMSWGTTSSIKVWDRTTGKLLNTLAASTTAQLLAMSISPDGKTVVECADTASAGTLNFWDVATGKLIRSVSDNNSNLFLSAAFSPDGKTFATGTTGVGGSPTARLYDVATGQLKRTYPTLATGGVHALVFSQNGMNLASVGMGGYQAPVAADASLLEFWTLAGVSTGTVFTAATNVTGAVSFANNGKVLVVPGTRQGMTATANVVDLYNSQTGEVQGPAHISARGIVTSTEYSPAQNAVAVASVAGAGTAAQAVALELRNPTTSALIQTFDVTKLGVIGSMAFTPNGKQLFITTGPSTELAYVCDVAKGGAPQPLAGLNQVLGVSRSNSSNIVNFLCAYGMTLVTRLWDVQAGHVISAVSSSLNTILGTDVSPDGRTLAMEGCNVFTQGSGHTQQKYAYGYIELWDIATGTLTTTLGGDPVAVPRNNQWDAIAFSPDGQYLFAVYNGPVAVSFVDHSIQHLQNGSEGSMAFSPDGSLVASGPWGEQGVNVASNPFFGPVAPSQLTLSQSTVTGGSSVTATITLAKPAPGKGVILSLSSSDARTTVPATLIVPAGKRTATFTIRTQKVTAKTTAKLTAAAGTATVTATLALK